MSQGGEYRIIVQDRVRSLERVCSYHAMTVVATVPRVCKPPSAPWTIMDSSSLQLIYIAAGDSLGVLATLAYIQSL